MVRSSSMRVSTCYHSGPFVRANIYMCVCVCVHLVVVWCMLCFFRAGHRCSCSDMPTSLARMAASRLQV